MERTKRHLPAAALSVLLSLTLAFCMIPAPAFATEGEQESGSAEADTTAVDNAESDIAGNETEGQQNAADDELGEGVIAGEQIDAADDEPVAGEADNGDEGESSQPEEQKTQVPVPQGKELIFNGEWQLGIDAAEGWVFACTDGAEGHFSAESGCMRMDAGDYSCTLRLKEGFVWDDGTTDDKTVTWTIKPKPIAVPVAAENLTESREPQRGIAEDEGYELSGDIEATEAGDYSATATLLPNYIWDDGTTEPKQIEWKIAEAELDAQWYPDYVPIPEGGRFEEGSYELDEWNDTFGYGFYCSNPVWYECDTLALGSNISYWDCGTHYITYYLDDPDSYCWEDGSIDEITIRLEIISNSENEYEREPQVYIGDCDIELSYSSCTYNGKARTPSVEIEGPTGYWSTDEWYDDWNDEWYWENTGWDTLYEDGDYTIEYSNNINAGTATVTIRGIGDYYGTVRKTFKIKPKSISEATVSLSKTQYTANGTAHKPAARVSLNGKSLKANQDFKVAYSNNKNAGQATVTVTGKGNYTGTAKAYFAITPTTQGWFKSGTSWFYKTKSGLASGWRQIGGTWYFFDRSTKVMQTGWKTIDGKKYHFTKNGAMESSCWKSNGKNWFYLTSSGAAKSGWLNSGGTWYYLNPSSKAMQTGLKEVGGKHYYFDRTGAMIHNSWRQIGYKWYYFTNSGAAKRGWMKWGSDWYWFDSDGQAASDKGVHINKSYCFFNYDGVWIKSVPDSTRGWVKAVNRQYYYDGDYCEYDTGLYYINSRGLLLGAETHGGSFKIGGYQYYFGEDGRVTYRENLYTGAYEYWSHDSSCYYHYGCDGCFWAAY
ncbi:MAG: hypothetical protein MSA55_04565 [Coriobacteriaceae bacterium]|nr:hypothetical protein [Coriobacteriaceae bacterium]